MFLCFIYLFEILAAEPGQVEKSLKCSRVGEFVFLELKLDDFILNPVPDDVTMGYEALVILLEEEGGLDSLYEIGDPVPIYVDTHFR